MKTIKQFKDKLDSLSKAKSIITEYLGEKKRFLKPKDGELNAILVWGKVTNSTLEEVESEIKVTPEFEKHQCQKCGSERKWVETIVDDEFVWNDITEQYEPNGFGDNFDHTGNVRCVECDDKWTGY